MSMHNIDVDIKWSSPFKMVGSSFRASSILFDNVNRITELSERNISDEEWGWGILSSNCAFLERMNSVTEIQSGSQFETLIL